MKQKILRTFRHTYETTEKNLKQINPILRNTNEGKKLFLISYQRNSIEREKNFKNIFFLLKKTVTFTIEEHSPDCNILSHMYTH